MKKNESLFQVTLAFMPNGYNTFVYDEPKKINLINIEEYPKSVGTPLAKMENSNKNLTSNEAKKLFIDFINKQSPSFNDMAKNCVITKIKKCSAYDVKLREFHIIKLN